MDPQSSKLTAVKMRFQVKQKLICFQIIWNSCDGLLLLSDSHFPFLANPSTGECIKLPDSPFFIGSDSSVSMYSFGYDTSVDDYKVVKICLEGSNVVSNDDVVRVYGLRTNSWRMITSSPHKFSTRSSVSGAFVNGALHWASESYVISLDLASDVFYSVPFPCSAGEIVKLRGVDVIGGSLCGYDYNFNLHIAFDVWVMKEYGVKDSWVKFTVDHPPLSWTLPSNSGKLLLCSGLKLASCDPQTGEVEELTARCVYDKTDSTTFEEPYPLAIAR